VVLCSFSACGEETNDGESRTKLVVVERTKEEVVCIPQIAVNDGLIVNNRWIICEPPLALAIKRNQQATRHEKLARSLTDNNMSHHS
jgi:hypothetical protein